MKLQRHNGCEWDNQGSFVYADKAEARIAELEAQITKVNQELYDSIEQVYLRDKQLAAANGLLSEIEVLLHPVFGRICVDGSFRLFPSHKKKLASILAKRGEK
jgi:hypothetical protein